MLRSCSSRPRAVHQVRQPRLETLEDRLPLAIDFDPTELSEGGPLALNAASLIGTPACAVSSNLTLPHDSRSADLNGDGWIDAADAEIMFGTWGQTGRADLNADGLIDAADAGLLFAAWNGDDLAPQRLEGSAASPFPFVSHPEQIPATDQGRSARLQQWFAPETLPGTITLTSLRFYLDQTSGPIGNDLDLTYAVELRVSRGPANVTSVSPFFPANLTGPVVKVFDSFITVAGHPAGHPLAARNWVDLPFSTPMTIDPTQGGWTIDLTVRGMFGASLDLVWDAVPAGTTSVALYSPDDRIIPFGQFLPNVPLIDFQAVPGVAIDPLVADHCLTALPLDPVDRTHLATDLSWLHLAGMQDDFNSMSSAIEQYRVHVEEAAHAGRIDTWTSDLLRQLGREEAIAVAGGLQSVRQEFAPFALHIEMGLPLFDLTWLSLERMAATGLPLDDPRTPPLLQWAQNADSHLANAFATAKEGTLDDPEFQKAYEELCKLIDKAKQDNTESPEVIKLLEDFKRILADPATIVRAFESLGKIIQDGDLDLNDLKDLNSLKDALKAMRKVVSADGILGKALDQVIRILCQLGAALDSRDLVSISVSTAGGKTFIRFDVNSEIEIRLLELLDLDTQSWYGKTDIAFDLHIKKDAVITLCPDGDDAQGVAKLKITFSPPDAIDLDIDSSGVWVVHVLEDLLGIPDLDQFCFSEIRYEDGKTIIEGSSGGKPVKITISGSGVTIEVDGKKVFPK